MTTKPLPPAWSETALWLTLPVTRQGCRFGFPSPSLSWESPGWPDNVPFSRNQRIRRRTGNRPPTSAIDPKTRAHSRTIVTPPAGCFSHPEVSGRRAPVTRLASLEQPLVAQRTPIDPARRPTSHRLSTTLGASANSATESGTRVASSWHPSHWSVTDVVQTPPRFASGPPRERASFRTNQSTFCRERLAREIPVEPVRRALDPALNRAFCACKFESAV